MIKLLTAALLVVILFICALGYDILLITKLRDRMRTSSCPLFPLEIKTMYGRDSEPLSDSYSSSLWRVPARSYAADRGRLFCVQMIMKELVAADDVGAFIQSIRELLALQEMDRPWSLDYEFIPSSLNSNLPTSILQKGMKPQRVGKMGGAYSAKALLCAISQCFQTPPAIDLLTQEGALAFRIYGTESSLHFCEVVADFSSDIRRTKEVWSSRPFQYSAALHLEVAESLVNILVHVFMNTHAKRPSTLLDPCCGSGTTLYVARRLGLKVIGRDCNERCINGARANLRHAGVDLDGMVQLRVQDASLSSSEGADLVIANFPWGINAVNYYGEIEDILRALRLELRPGCIAGFIVKDASFYERALRSNRFQVLHSIRLDNNAAKSQKPSQEEGTDDPSSFAVVAIVIN